MNAQHRQTTIVEEVLATKHLRNILIRMYVVGRAVPWAAQWSIL